MDWLYYSLLCAFFLATADALTKWKLAGCSTSELAFLRFAAPGMLLLPVLLFRPLPHFPPEFWGWVLAAIPLELAAMVLYMKAIRISPLHLTLPYLAFSPAFSALFAYWLLGEKVAISGLSGIALIVFGALLLNRGRMIDPFRAIFAEPGSRMMLVVSLLYGLTSVLGKGALQYCPPLQFGALYFLLLAICFFPAYLHQKGALQKKPFWTLLVGILMSLMVVFHFAAISLAQVSYMIAVKRTSLLFGILYGAFLFGERGLLLHLLAGSVMVLGVALLSMG
ncbi:MAG: DMT family transporter [Burkholderiales bacterium]|nr:DMT family transporter [Burkholderiales bacterium]